MFRRAAPVLFLLSSIIAAGQTASDSPEFEAASVKPVPLGTPYGGMRGGPGSTSPGQISYQATTLRALVAKAYDVQRFQIAGPPWFDDQRFDIVAKLPPGTTVPQFQLMLRKLLADRFHLELHHDNRPLSVYELTVAKSGLKMTPVPLPATPAAPTNVAPSSAMQWSVGENIELKGRGATMRQFLVWLTEETGREIVDKTGLTEAYDFDIAWPQAASTDPDDPLFAGMLDAVIEKSLGLKVTASKVPVDMLIIDRLDRSPVAN